mmetsp:Transcript_24852/g.42702  ORF Transcript_24852/g.42702 Transcript_24852/m.42702 type:complete len:133 (+) Transcript_24852:338-736(+)
MQQLLVTGDAPEGEGRSVRRRIGIRVELHHGFMARQPGRMRVTRIQGRVFQQTQAPAMRSIEAARTVEPVKPVIGMAAQILPGQCQRIQAQHVEVGGSRIPVREVVRFGHDANSRRAGRPSPVSHANVTASN